MGIYQKVYAEKGKLKWQRYYFNTIVHFLIKSIKQPKISSI
jgi:hypothetical protein